MIDRLLIESFRSFERFEIEDLGRVNLLVGRNNCGKTSILEAIEMLVGGGRIHDVFAGLKRRREQIWVLHGEVWRSRFDAKRLFHGHDPKVGDTLTVTSSRLRFDLGVIEPSPESAINLSRFATLELDDDGADGIDGPLPERTTLLSIDAAGAIASNGALTDRQLRMTFNEVERSAGFVTSRGVDHADLVVAYGDVALTDAESTILDALRLLEPGIERMAVVSQKANGGSRPAVADNELYVKLAGIDQRLPLGSLGDGIGRMLGLILAMVDAEGGVLLVDEIDTGLHYSTLKTLWNLLFDLAERLDVQIFATTHSEDCWTALAQMIAERGVESTSASIQRIEGGAERAVAFDPAEIVAAAEHSVEVR